MIPSIAEDVGNAISAGDNRACSNRKSRENECSNVIFSTEEGDCSKKLLYNEGR